MTNFNVDLGKKYREIFVVSAFKFLFVYGTEEGGNHIKIISNR